MLISDGQLVTPKMASTTVWSGTTTSDPWAPHYASYWPTGLTYTEHHWASYGAIYRSHLWPYVLVNKLANAQARLPLKVYERGVDGRSEVRDHPYARLLARPSSFLDPFSFWQWTASTHLIHGEAWWLKIRDSGGRPVELVPIHPTKVSDPERKAGRWVYELRISAEMTLTDVDQADLVPFLSYHPDSLTRGLSPLEPLRSTLENEAAARSATSAFWKRGARPGTALVHPGELSEGAQKRLKRQFDGIAAGADKTGVTVVLEEGMKPEKLDLTAEEAQYIETRKLNREESCAAYDTPPPAVHILDRATFSNITENLRSMYRDTMGPKLNKSESVLETHLRGSVRRGSSEPDFGGDVYAEFLLDEVLRGDFETRQAAYRNADYMTIAEKRAKENLPFIPGTDRIVINAASIPLDSLDEVTNARVPATTISQNSLRAAMGRTAWQTTLDDVDPDALTAGLGTDAAIVLAHLDASRSADEDVSGFRQRLRELETT